MKADDTIFAAATAPGRAGIAVLRISGQEARSALASLGVTPLPAPRMATLSLLRHPATQALIDRGLALWFPAPASFTGEDVAELHVHGSRAVLQALLGALAGLPGMRIAEPGEFARRAFQAGKMDLTEAEGLADVLEAETPAQLAQALSQMQGHLRAQYDAMRSEIIRALARLEAYIDFPDEDIPDSMLSAVQNGVTALRERIARALQDGRRGQRIREGVTIAILGAPNAGKSSLLNALAGRDMAIVSPHAGTTRDIIEAPMNIGGYAVVLIDTAGLRDSGNEIEQEGIRRARTRAAAADLTLVLFDATNLPHLDAESLAMLSHNSLAILSKADDGHGSAEVTIAQQRALPLSIFDQNSIDSLRQRLENWIGDHYDQREAPLITRERHRVALVDAHSHLMNYDDHLPLELACEELRLAAVAIGKITGAIVTDELLECIFKEFCIGK